MFERSDAVAAHREPRAGVAFAPGFAMRREDGEILALMADALRALRGQRDFALRLDDGADGEGAGRGLSRGGHVARCAGEERFPAA